MRNLIYAFIYFQKQNLEAYFKKIAPALTAKPVMRGMDTLMPARKPNFKIQIAVLSVLIVCFCALTMLILSGKMSGFESGVYTYLIKYQSPALTSIMIAITNMGSTIAVVTIVIGFLLIPPTRIKFGIPITINAIISAVLNHFIKIIIARDRPNILRLITETGYGFPSGHAMNNAALYTMILLIIFSLTKNKKLRISALIFGAAISFFIGISRIYLGVHNAGDVLAGWMLGIAVALAVDAVWVFR